MVCSGTQFLHENEILSVSFSKIQNVLVIIFKNWITNVSSVISFRVAENLIEWFRDSVELWKRNTVAQFFKNSNFINYYFQYLDNKCFTGDFFNICRNGSDLGTKTRLSHENEILSVSFSKNYNRRFLLFCLNKIMNLTSWLGSGKYQFTDLGLLRALRLSGTPTHEKDRPYLSRTVLITCNGPVLVKLQLRQVTQAIWFGPRCDFISLRIGRP